MKKKFFKNLFEKENNLQMYSINEFNVFRDIISFSKIEVYKEMKEILSDIDKNIDRQMAETVEKYHIVMGLKAQTEEINSHLTGAEEEIDVVISNSKEANIIARYSEKMLHKLLEIGFASSDRELERKAMTVTYSKRIMMKLDNIAKKDPAFVDECYRDDIEECREEGEFKDIEGSCGAADNADESDNVEFSGELKIGIYGEDDESVSDKNNTSGVDEGGNDMIDEKYSKEAYDLFVKGDDHEVAEEKKNLGEEEYDVIIRESTDMVLRDNKDKEKVGEEAYEELIKGRKIKEVEESEY